MTGGLTSSCVSTSGRWPCVSSAVCTRSAGGTNLEPAGPDRQPVFVLPDGLRGPRYPSLKARSTASGLSRADSPRTHCGVTAGVKWDPPTWHLPEGEPPRHLRRRPSLRCPPGSSRSGPCRQDQHQFPEGAVKPLLVVVEAFIQEKHALPTRTRVPCHVQTVGKGRFGGLVCPPPTVRQWREKVAAQQPRLWPPPHPPSTGPGADPEAEASWRLCIWEKRCFLSRNTLSGR